MIVVDASVAAKWFLNEEYCEQADALLTLDHKLVGPMLAQYEVAGSFIRAKRRKDITQAGATNCLDRWLHSLKTNVMQLSYDQQDIVVGSELALKLDHPLADCIYLAMAKRVAATLVTADVPFLEKTKKKHEVVFVADVLQLAA